MYTFRSMFHSMYRRSSSPIFRTINWRRLRNYLSRLELRRGRDRIRKILADEKNQRNQKEFVRFINKKIRLSTLQIGSNNVKTMPLNFLSNWNYQQAINLSVGGKTVWALQTYINIKTYFNRDPNGVRVNLENGRFMDGWCVTIIIPTKENDNISTIENPISSKFDDELIGDDNSNIITGDRGNNILKGGGGNGKIYGDKRIYIYGDKGDDEIWGDVGNDLLYDKGGNNDLDGGAGKDMLYDGDNNDILLGFAENDILDAFYYSGYSEITHSEFDTKILRYYKACQAYSNSVYMRKYVNWCRYPVSVNIRSINSSIGTNIAIFKKCEKPHKQESRKFKETGSNKKGKSYFYREPTKTMAA